MASSEFTGFVVLCILCCSEIKDCITAARALCVTTCVDTGDIDLFNNDKSNVTIIIRSYSMRLRTPRRAKAWAGNPLFLVYCKKQR